MWRPGAKGLRRVRTELQSFGLVSRGVKDKTGVALRKGPTPYKVTEGGKRSRVGRWTFGDVTQETIKDHGVASHRGSKSREGLPSVKEPSVEVCCRI